MDKKGTDLVQNGSPSGVEPAGKGLPDSNFCLKKQGSEVVTSEPCFAPIDLTKHWSDLAQNGAELPGNERHKFNPSNIPISGVFDFEAAFPSVIHRWIWLVLQHRKMPAHFINLFKAVYKNAKADYTHNGITYTLVNFLSGVLQGCPASAFLFNNALGPFLTRFHSTLRSK